MGMSTVGLRQDRALRPGLRAAALPAFAGALSLSAAIAHLGVAAPHFREWWLHGAFFVACGVLQALFAVLIMWRPRTWLVLTGIAGNLAIMSMYVYSRTNGPPVGPHEGVPEPPGVYDLMTTAGEFVLVVVLVLMLGERARRWAMRLVVLVAAALWTAKATGVLT
jgi:hypothetical protein